MKKQRGNAQNIFVLFIAVVLISIFAVAAVTKTLRLSPLAHAAGQNSLSAVASAQTVSANGQFTVAITENSTEVVNAVEADLTYTGNLTVVSIDSSNSAFGIQAQQTFGNGKVTLARGTTTPVTGSQTVAMITFQASTPTAANQPALIQFAGTSALLSSTTNQNILQTTTGATVTIMGIAIPTPQPTVVPTIVPSVTPSHTPVVSASPVPGYTISLACSKRSLTATWTRYPGAWNYHLQISTSPARNADGSFVRVTGDPHWNRWTDSSRPTFSLHGPQSGITYYAVVRPVKTRTTYATMATVKCL